MYKANINNLRNVQCNFSKNKDIHGYNTRNKNNFHTNNVSKVRRKLSINSRGVAIWNGLNRQIKESKSLGIFKNKLKKEMFSKY